jgi:hypothetical protein
MKNVLLMCFLSNIAQVISSQNIEIGDISDGRTFLKRVENNLLSDGYIISGEKKSNMYNFTSKTDMEKLLFGDFNAMVEFFINPSFEGAYGFRIVKDSSNVEYIIEHKRISNWDTVMSQVSREFPTIGITVDKMLSVTKDESDKMATHNMEMYDKQYKASLCRYEVSIQSASVSNLFAEKLYECIHTAIYHYTGKGIPAFIMDGYSATLRCVIVDEVWTLTVHEPKEEVEQIVGICKQLMENIKEKKINEAYYIALFEKITSSIKQLNGS